MTRLPRALSGAELAKALERMGYRIDRQTGGHMRLTTTIPSEHHITIPNHPVLKIGTLSAILREVEVHSGLSRPELLARLFD